MEPTKWKDARTREERPRVIQSDATAPVKCACGARVEPGGMAFAVIALPNPLDGIFRGQLFCSPRCIRAFCLEALETLDAIDVPSSREMVTDLHELTMEVAETLVALL